MRTYQLGILRGHSKNFRTKSNSRDKSSLGNPETIFAEFGHSGNNQAAFKETCFLASFTLRCFSLTFLSAAQSIPRLRKL